MNNIKPITCLLLLIDDDEDFSEIIEILDVYDYEYLILSSDDESSMTPWKQIVLFSINVEDIDLIIDIVDEFVALNENDCAKYYNIYRQNIDVSSVISSVNHNNGFIKFKSPNDIKL